MEIGKSRNRFSWVGNILLFSALGCFSLFFLVYYAGIPVRHQEKVMTVQVIVSTMLLFNGIGLSLKYVDNWLTRTYPSFIRNRRMLIVFWILAAIFLWLTNYALLVAIQLLIGNPHPFGIATHGMRLLVIIFLVELFITGQMMVNRFYKNLIEMYQHTKELEDSAIKTRYMALQSQLNPHFLFNSLNTLVAEIEYAPRQAVEFTRNLSDIYRYILSCQHKQLVPLSGEIDFIERFVFLHRVRLGDCLTLDNRVPEELYESSLPPLTLQLLVENVIKHNVISSSCPMTIRMEVEKRTDGDWLVVSNPVHLKQGVPVSGKGLSNLSQRNRLLWQKDIIVENRNNCFTVKVPMLNEYE